MTEPELIQALKLKQEAAFNLLVEKYKDKVYNTILGMVQNLEDAEDLSQDVFIRVYEKFYQFKGDATLATWLYRIAVTLSLDLLRKKNRARKMKALAFWFRGGKKEIGSTDFVHPGVIAENKERSAILLKAVEQLPEKQKTAFVLKKIEGLTQQEIAGVLEISEGAVEALLTRAKSNLKLYLTEYYSA